MRSSQDARKKTENTTSQSLESKLWATVDKLRGYLDADYKHVVLELIFLKYISDRFAQVPCRDFGGRRPLPAVKVKSARTVTSLTGSPNSSLHVVVLVIRSGSWSAEEWPSKTAFPGTTRAA